MATELLMSRMGRSRTRASAQFDVVAANAEYSEICRKCRAALSAAAQRRIKVWSFRQWNDIDWRRLGGGRPKPLLVVCRLADIPDDAAAIRGVGPRDRKHLLFVEDMPVEAIPSRVPPLNIRDPHKLHIARERDAGRVAAIIARAIGAMAGGAQRRKIVDAWIEDDHLVVLASSFARLRIPLAKLAPHLGRDRDQVRAFEIDEDGAFLYWAGADAHLGLDQLAAVVDPTFAIAMQRKSSEFNRQYGKAIRALRAESGVTQAAIAGVTARHLRRIECGQLGPTSAVLRSLAAAHRMDVTRYLAEVARRLTG